LVFDGKIILSMIKYCRTCLFPNTKPDLFFDDSGECNACSNYKNRAEINWQERLEQLKKILDKYKSEDGKKWDCIIPVSGGKDSTYQVVQMLELGMNPLCVTATTCHLSDLGRENIENIKNLGVDYIEMSPNPVVRRKLNRIGLTQVGDISWPEHVGIFTIPVRAAVMFNVPLIIWGENPQNEYGGPAAATKSNILDRRWLEEFGGLLGLRVSDLPGLEDIKQSDLIPYHYPEQKDLNRVGVTGLFLGYFIPWDGNSNALIAQAHGFKSKQKIVEGSIVNYENLDNYQTGIHDYFKYLKFGFGRTTDILNMFIRRGRISRSHALELVKVHDGAYPKTCLDKPLKEILEPLNIEIDEFNNICDKFTNKKIFKTNADGKLFKDSTGRPIKLNYDNE
jgi:N-acetyl sugar amidotransferase